MCSDLGLIDVIIIAFVRAPDDHDSEVRAALCDNLVPLQSPKCQYDLTRGALLMDDTNLVGQVGDADAVRHGYRHRALDN